MTAPASELMTPTDTSVVQSHKRDVMFSGPPRYLPVELPVGREYREVFNVIDGVAPEDTIRAAAKTGGSYRPLVEEIPITKGPNDSLEMLVDSPTTARLYAVALRNNIPVGEWRMMGDSGMAAPTALATGPVTFIIPNKRALTWIEIGAGPGGATQKEMVISLRATERGPWQAGTAYKQGDLVTLDGHTFMAIADLDGSAGTGPNTNPNDANTNTILTEVFPPGTTRTATDTTLDAAESNPAAAAAGGGE